MIRLYAAALALSFLSVCLGADALAEPIASHQVRVIDGHMIRLNGTQPDVRLVGFNAPETRRALCAAERELGGKATRRLRDLIESGSPLELTSVPCSCRSGTEGTPACNYGRRCGVLKVNGVDVGRVLVGEGLAVDFKCGATSCPPTPKPWC